MKVTKQEQKEYKQYRDEHFVVEATKEYDEMFGAETVFLAIAPNGRQFSTIRFTRKEWIQIKKAVAKAWRRK